MSARLVVVLIAAAIVAPATASAQNSIFGIRGTGFPGRQVSARARALGDAWGPFDRTSTVNPATIATFTSLGVSATGGTTRRRYSIDETDVSGLVETRFPHAVLGGRVGGLPVSFAVSFSTYAERSWAITRTDTVSINNAPVAVVDSIASDGGIVDARAALGWRISAGFQVGAAFHLINGSTRVTARREFVDREFGTFLEESNVNFRGIGVSVGFRAVLAQQRLQLAGAARFDNNLKSTVESSNAQTTTDLPASVNGGVSLVMTSQLRWSVAGAWYGWGQSNDDLAVETFDTWQIGSGFEFGGVTSRFPLRVGVRYATLPFSPVASQPHEWGFSAGTGTRFASNRGQLNVTIERLLRDGARVVERAWHVSVGISIQP